MYGWMHMMCYVVQNRETAGIESWMHKDKHPLSTTGYKTMMTHSFVIIDPRIVL